MPKAASPSLARLARSIFTPLRLLQALACAKDAQSCLKLARVLRDLPLLGARWCKRLDFLQLSPDEAGYFAARTLLTRLLGRKIVTPVHLANPQVLRQLAQASGSAIIASAHYPDAPVMQLCLDHCAGRKLLVLTDHPDQMAGRFARYLVWPQHQPPAQIAYLQADSHCLAKLRPMLAQGWIVLCNVDKPAVGGYVYDTVYPGIFRLAERTGTPLYAANCQLDSAGTLNVDVAPLPSGAQQAAAGFIAHQAPIRAFKLAPIRA